MTLTTYTPARYTGTNSTAVYAFAFRILEDADLVVIQTDLGGVESTLALTTDYTVTGAGSYSGGSITLLAGDLPTGYGLTLKRVVGIDQPTSIRNQGAFFSEVHEKVFDRLTMIDQQQQEQIDRAAVLPSSVTGGILPVPTSGTVLGWLNGAWAWVAAASSGLQELLAGDTGAAQIGTLAPYTGAVTRTQQSKDNDSINVADFMTSAQLADVLAGSMTAGFSTDNTNSVQNAINACGNLGKNLILPNGPILVDDSNAVNNYCLIVTRPITITGGGFNSAIVPKSTVGATADTIRIDPSPSYWCKVILQNFTIGSPNTGTRYGNRGVFLNTSVAGSNAPKFTMRDMNIYEGSGGTKHAFSHINSAANNPNGGMYAALIENCSLVGGIYLSDSGDSNVIQKNIISGSNIGILYSNVAGASCLNIEANNITATGGAIKGDYGSRTVIRHNNIELPSGAGSNSAIIDLNNGNGTSYGGCVEYNHIAGFGTSTATSCLRVANHNGLVINGNVFLTGATSLVTAINIVSGNNIKIAPQTYGASPQFTPSAYAGGTTYGAGAYVTSLGYNWVSLAGSNTGNTPESSPTWWRLTSGPKILDGGNGTCGVIKPLPALQAGWVWYGTSRSIPLMYKGCDGIVHLQGALASGTTTAGTTLTTLPAGFYPKGLLNINVHSLGGAVAGLGTILFYGSVGAGTVEIRAAGATILCLDGVSFLADGLADGVSAE